MNYTFAKSEITEKYKSPMAKNSIGETVWTNGVVSRTLKVKPRRVILSRYCKPMRIVGLEEYAQSVKKLLEDNNVLENGIPFSVLSYQRAWELTLHKWVSVSL